METIVFDNQYFNIKDTLDCGQIFRYTPFDKGYLVFSCDKCAYCYTEKSKTIIQVEDGDKSYFLNYFDLEKDYSKIVEKAISSGVSALVKSAKLAKGVRILKQDAEEMLFSFMISQNNNIPRIKNSIDKLCTLLGDKKEFLGVEYHAFPTAEKMAEQTLEFYKSIGLGYRAEYVKNLAQKIAQGYVVSSLEKLSTKELKNQLVSIHGVGPKVADCVSLFGFNRTDSFPVDTWIEKVYVQDFKGNQKDRKKIADELSLKFGENAGFFQQYLFYYKRSLEGAEAKK